MVIITERISNKYKRKIPYERMNIRDFLKVTTIGFKPITFASVVRCSIQLSYVAIALLRVQRYRILAN